jgi:hypothetical protein
MSAINPDTFIGKCYELEDHHIIKVDSVKQSDLSTSGMSMIYNIINNELYDKTDQHKMDLQIFISQLTNKKAKEVDCRTRRPRQTASLERNMERKMESKKGSITDSIDAAATAAVEEEPSLTLDALKRILYEIKKITGTDGKNVPKNIPAQLRTNSKDTREIPQIVAESAREGNDIKDNLIQQLKLFKGIDLRALVLWNDQQKIASELLGKDLNDQKFRELVAENGDERHNDQSAADRDRMNNILKLQGKYEERQRQFTELIDGWLSGLEIINFNSDNRDAINTALASLRTIVKEIYDNIYFTDVNIGISDVTQFRSEQLNNLKLQNNIFLPDSLHIPIPTRKQILGKLNMIFQMGTSANPTVLDRVIIEEQLSNEQGAMAEGTHDFTLGRGVVKDLVQILKLSYTDNSELNNFRVAQLLRLTQDLTNQLLALNRENMNTHIDEEAMASINFSMDNELGIPRIMTSVDGKHATVGFSANPIGHRSYPTISEKIKAPEHVADAFSTIESTGYDFHSIHINSLISYKDYRGYDAFKATWELPELNENDRLRSLDERPQDIPIQPFPTIEWYDVESKINELDRSVVPRLPQLTISQSIGQNGFNISLRTDNEQINSVLGLADNTKLEEASVTEVSTLMIKIITGLAANKLSNEIFIQNMVNLNNQYTQVFISSGKKPTDPKLVYAHEVTRLMKNILMLKTLSDPVVFPGIAMVGGLNNLTGTNGGRIVVEQQMDSLLDIMRDIANNTTTPSRVVNYFRNDFTIPLNIMATGDYSGTQTSLINIMFNGGTDIQQQRKDLILCHAFVHSYKADTISPVGDFSILVFKLYYLLINATGDLDLQSALFGPNSVSVLSTNEITHILELFSNNKLKELYLQIIAAENSCINLYGNESSGKRLFNHPQNQNQSGIREPYDVVSEFVNDPKNKDTFNKLDNFVSQSASTVNVTQLRDMLNKFKLLETEISNIKSGTSYLTRVTTELLSRSVEEVSIIKQSITDLIMTLQFENPTNASDTKKYYDFAYYLAVLLCYPKRGSIVPQPLQMTTDSNISDLLYSLLRPASAPALANEEEKMDTDVLPQSIAASSNPNQQMAPDVEQMADSHGNKRGSTFISENPNPEPNKYPRANESLGSDDSYYTPPDEMDIEPPINNPSEPFNPAFNPTHQQNTQDSEPFQPQSNNQTSMSWWQRLNPWKRGGNISRHSCPKKLTKKHNKRNNKNKKRKTNKYKKEKYYKFTRKIRGTKVPL